MVINLDHCQEYEQSYKTIYKDGFSNYQFGKCYTLDSKIIFNLQHGFVRTRNNEDVITVCHQSFEYNIISEKKIECIRKFNCKNYIPFTPHVINILFSKEGCYKIYQSRSDLNYSYLIKGVNGFDFIKHRGYDNMSIMSPNYIEKVGIKGKPIYINYKSLLATQHGINHFDGIKFDKPLFISRDVAIKSLQKTYNQEIVDTILYSIISHTLVHLFSYISQNIVYCIHQLPIISLLILLFESITEKLLKIIRDNNSI